MKCMNILKYIFITTVAPALTYELAFQRSHANKAYARIAGVWKQVRYLFIDLFKILPTYKNGTDNLEFMWLLHKISPVSVNESHSKPPILF